MTLPFEKDNSRKFQCFVCGKSHHEFDAFRQHIIDNHEEGREYVLCPIIHCNSPVRCLRSHYRAKHIGEKMPQKCQSKAIIWKDQRSGSDKVKTRKPAFRNGSFISLKNGGKEFAYKSGLECEVLELLEQIPEVMKFDYEPFKSGIEYLYDGKMHKYHPDLSVQFSDGHIEVWEVKPGSQTDLPVNEAKWRSATAYCQSRNWEFIVITETGVAKLRKLVRRTKLLIEEKQQVRHS